MFQFPGRQYFEMDGVHIKLKVSGLRAFHSLVNNRKSVARQYLSYTNTLKELRRCCSSICGYNTYEIQTIFCTVQPLLKTIVAPFLPTRLTSSGSPRMEWATIRKKKNWRTFCNLDPVENSTQHNNNDICLYISLFAAFWKTVSLNNQFKFILWRTWTRVVRIYSVWNQHTFE